MYDNRKTKAQLIEELAACRRQLEHLQSAADGEPPRSSGPQEGPELDLRFLVETMYDGLAVADAEGRLIYVNEKCCRMGGYRREELIGRPVRDIIAPEDHPTYDAKRRDRPQSPFDCYELRFLRKDGGTVPTRASISAVLSADGRVEKTFAVITDITESKRVEGELRESEQRFRRIMEDLSRVAVQGYYPDGEIFYWNKASERLYGYTAAEALGRDMIELIIPRSDRAAMRKALGRAANTGQAPSPCELTTRHRNGSLLAVFASQSLVERPDGRTEIYCFDIDLAEQKKAEQRARQYEQQQQALLNSLPDAAWMKDLQGRFIAVNEAMCSLLGRGPHEILSKPDCQADSSPVAAWIRQGDETVVRSGAPLRFREKLVKRDGREVWFETIKTPIRDEAGHVVGISGIARDVTQHQEAQRALERSERKYRALIETTGTGYIILDEQGYYIDMNEETARIVGCTPEEVFGTHVLDWCAEYDLERAGAEFAKVFEQGFIRHVQVDTVGKDGRIVPVEVNSTLMREGDSMRVISLIRDISERRRTEEELNLYREQMTRAERLAALGMMSATVAHELSQPLTVIRLLIQDTLERLKRDESPETARNNLRETLQEVARSSEIIQRFRHFARPSTPKRCKIHLDRVIGRILNLLQRPANRSKLHIQCGSGLALLPPVLGSPADFEQIAFILVENAIHAADGRRWKHLKVDGCAGEMDLTVTFEDDCGGIDPEHREKIFEPFFTTKPREKGTGLGLTIARQILKGYGGRLEVASEKDKHTIFTLTLPIQSLF